MSEENGSVEVEFVLAAENARTTVARVDFVEPSLNLLAHAQAIELEIGSRCGGHGICGGDRIRLLGTLPSLSPITEAEREHLSEAEIAQGYRLACQCFPNDSAVSLRAELFPAQLV